ncbi:MAG: hypothetical protein WDO15_14295 [Bacteroidota bacterium]
MQLFQVKYNCNSCHHVEEVTMTPRLQTSGLQENYTDNGLGVITKDTRDNGKFLVPSLRNVELTAPYMHDGSLATLEKVVQHYSDGIANHPSLHPELKDENGNPKKMNIPGDEVDAIVAFLKTLTDKSIHHRFEVFHPFQ